MKDINKVILVGRLGANPIQRMTKAGTAVTHFSIATTRKFYKENTNPNVENSLAEETQWHRIVTWGKQAESCGLYLKKGNIVYIEGSIRSHSYENKEGQNKISFEIQAENVSFLGGKSYLNDPLDEESRIARNQGRKTNSTIPQALSNSHLQMNVD